MALVYSPYHRRYVLSLTPQVDYMAAVYRAVEFTPLVAKGSIEAYGFPDSADVGVDKPWTAKVHNVGGVGKLGLGIGNPSGNPGNIAVTWEGTTYTIEPGNYLRISTSGEVPYCTRIDTSGQIAFQAEGSYTLRILALHLDGATWYIDDERKVTVTVTGVTPPEDGAKVKTIPILVNKQITVPLLWHGNSHTQTIDLSWDSNKTTVTKATLQARAYTDSDAMQMDFYMNAVKVGDVSWPAFQSHQWKEATVNVLSRLAIGTNIFKFDYYFTFAPGRGANAWVYADLIIEYTGDEPAASPGVGDPWEWIKKNSIWIGAGGVALGAVYLVTRRREPLIVITSPALPYRRREEE